MLKAKRRQLKNKIDYKLSPEIKGLNFSVLTLKKNESYAFNALNREKTAVLIKGKIKISDIAVSVTLGERKSPFSSLPWAFYSCEKSVLIKALKDSEIALISAPRIKKYKSYAVKPPETVSKTVGKKNYQRKVTDIISPEKASNFLLIGETVNPEGNWSSYPPHKHDTVSKKENKLKEIYFYKLEPEDGFALQCVYDNKKYDEVIKVKSGDAVKIPGGYHPVVVMGLYKLYYLWVLFSPRRRLKYTFEKRKRFKK